MVKQSKSVTADSGYGSEENYEYLMEMMGYADKPVSQGTA